MNHRDKIKGDKELIEIAESLKKQGKKIVHCHGCFDILHPGHLRYLEFAKNQGDILIVSLSGDEFIGKGIKTPFATSKLRAESMASVVFVDYIIIDENPDAYNLIIRLKPDVYIKGKEYAFEKKEHPGFLKEKNCIEGYGGKVIYSPGDIVFSSTKIINELFEREDMIVERCRSYLMKHRITKEMLEKIIQGFNKSKVLIIGDLFFEDIILCDYPTLSKESPIFNLNVIREERNLNGVFSFAEQINKLEAKADVLFIKGKRKDSLEAIEKLKRFPDESINFIEIDDYDIPVNKKFISKNQKLFEVNFRKKLVLDGATESRIIEFINKKIQGYDGIIFCDYGNGFLTKNIVEAVIQKAKKENTLTTIINSPNSGRNLNNYPNIDFVMIDQEEARNLVNDFSYGFDFLSKKVMTLGSYGNLILDLGNEGFICYRPPELEETAGNYASYLPTFSFKNKISSDDMKTLKLVTTLSRFSGGDIYSSLYIGDMVTAIASPASKNNLVSAEDLFLVLDNRKELFN